MSKPTIVLLQSGTSASGYTFCATNYQNQEFTCRYDGTHVDLNIFVLGIRVSQVLHLVHGLFHEGSNFKKKLFHEYFYLRPKEIKSISFTSTTGYKFTITKESNPNQLVREYYRFYHYVVYENDTENDIINRAIQSRLNC